MSKLYFHGGRKEEEEKKKSVLEATLAQLKLNSAKGASKTAEFLLLLFFFSFLLPPWKYNLDIT